MLNPQIFVRICSENGVDPDKVRFNAEAIAKPQSHKCWGLTDSQSDVIAAMHSFGTIQAAVNLAIGHYRKVNGG